MYNEENLFNNEVSFTSEGENIFIRKKYKGYFFYILLGYVEKEKSLYWILKNDKLGECLVKYKEIKDIK